MIVLIQEGNDRMLFDNVTAIVESTKPSIFNEGVRQVIHLYNGDTVLMGGDDINPMTANITILPYAEREPT